jgi:hypothetical protein
MIIKSLLFIIVCIFCYETYKNINKMTEEYFTTLDNNNNKNNKNNIEKFIELTGKPELDDISKTIAINCYTYDNKYNNIMIYKPENNNVLDTPYYAQYKKLEYDPNRQYFWKRDKLFEEGIRRSNDDDIEIAKIQDLFDKEQDIDKKKKLQDELYLFIWRNNILQLKDTKTNLSRDKIDITTDYYPKEIGLQRPWIERHSHLPNYSY